MIGFIKNLKIMPRWIIVLIDLCLFLFAVVIGYLLRFNFDFSAIADSNVRTGIPLFTIAGLVATGITKSYSGIIRYTGFQDASRVFTTVTFAAIICVVSNIFNGTYLIPYSVLAIAYMASMVLLINYRVVVKYIFAFYGRIRSQISNVIIFGAGESGQITRDIFENTSGANVRVVGYLEDDQNKSRKILNGVEIYYAKQDLGALFERLNITELVISVQNLALDRKDELVSAAIQSGVKVKHVPPVYQWVDGQLKPNQIKEIKIDDLLGRDTIKLDNYYVTKEIEGKTVFITGAAGSIGSELVRQALIYKPRILVLLDQWESGLFEIINEVSYSVHETSVISKIVDVTNESRMRSLFDSYKPDIVFHAAAYKHVPLMENNPSEAIVCNVGGTKIVADLSIEFKVDKFLMISTDKAVNPTNVMGASKRIAEMYVQALNHMDDQLHSISTKFITTRFGNVLGSNGSVIPVFEEQIKRGGPITVTHPDISRYFMTIPEACQLVLEAGAMGKGGEIFIFDMGRSVKIVDLAQKMIQLSGFMDGSDIDIIFTGLREGEKLHEELLTNKENNTPTYHDKIRIAKVERVAYFKMEREVTSLLNIASKEDDFKTVEKMKSIIPEYISNASRFQTLDKQSG